MAGPWILAIAPAAGLAADVAIQIGSFRSLRRMGLLKSVFAGFAGGGAVTAALCLGAGGWGRGPEADVAGQLLWALATYAALGYGYFHFLNLGETARRVRILREFHDSGGEMSMDELLRRYNARQIIAVRLGRLLGNGQIELRDGRYYIARPTVRIMAEVITAMKRLILGKGSEFD